MLACVVPHQVQASGSGRLHDVVEHADRPWTQSSEVNEREAPCCQGWAVRAAECGGVGRFSARPRRTPARHVHEVGRSTSVQWQRRSAHRRASTKVEAARDARNFNSIHGVRRHHCRITPTGHRREDPPIRALRPPQTRGEKGRPYSRRLTLIVDDRKTADRRKGALPRPVKRLRRP